MNPVRTSTDYETSATPVHKTTRIALHTIRVTFPQDREVQPVKETCSLFRDCTNDSILLRLLHVGGGAEKEEGANEGKVSQQAGQLLITPAPAGEGIVHERRHLCVQKQSYCHADARDTHG